MKLLDLKRGSLYPETVGAVALSTMNLLVKKQNKTKPKPGRAFEMT